MQRLVNFIPSLYTRYLLLMLIVLQTQQMQAQIFPGLTGEILADAIRENYTPTILLNDTQVKDTLYAKVFLKEDSVRCIYSGLSRFLPDGEDPSIWLFNDGSEVGSVNLEHGWPKSKGAGDGTGGSTNMYHLFPARTGINSDRAAHPYGEIDDNQTARWYYKAIEMSSIPSGDRSLYSEYISGEFEPRESVKGDVARAMFYFWTIYREDALAADPFYFESQREDLCLWHLEDPVDEEEMTRNIRIAPYQGGLDNPFIVDCSLVMRAYCDELPDCEIVSTEMTNPLPCKLGWNSATNQLTIIGDSHLAWKVEVYDVLGRAAYSTVLNTNEISESLDLPTGHYIISAFHGPMHLAGQFYVH
jgi:endonuclease I